MDPNALCPWALQLSAALTFVHHHLAHILDKPGLYVGNSVANSFFFSFARPDNSLPGYGPWS